METAERQGRSRSHGRTIIIAIAIAGVVVAAPYLLIFGSMSWQALSERAARRPFDSAAWRAHTTMWVDHEPLRLRMVDDLLERRLLDGRTRAEVVALLGEPPAGNVLESRGEKFDLIYWLGPARGTFSSMSEEWLAIRLGPRGRVVDARVVIDY